MSLERFKKEVKIIILPIRLGSEAVGNLILEGTPAAVDRPTSGAELVARKGAILYRLSICSGRSYLLFTPL